MAERRSHLLLLGLIIAALIGGCPARGPGLADPQEAGPRPRPPGRHRGRPQGGPAERRAGHLRGHGHGPVGHAQARRQARRDRAGDPEAGQRPDGDRARRRQPGSRPGSDREDRAARALRPPGRPGPADGRPPGESDPADLALQDAVAGAVAGQGEGLPGVLPLRPREEAGLEGDELQARRGAVPDRKGASGLEVRARQRQAGRGAEGHQGDVRAGEPRARQVHPGPRRSARTSARRRRPTTTSSSTTRTRTAESRRDPGDDRVRPQPQGHAPGLRDAGHRQRPAARAHGFHARRREEVPERDANAGRARPYEVADGR